MSPAEAIDPVTDHGLLLVLTIALPAVAVLVALVLGGRRAERVALALLPLQVILALAIAGSMWRAGRPLVYYLGSWAPPLGLALRADRWLLPDRKPFSQQTSCDPIGDCPTLTGSVAAFELGNASLEELATIVQMLGRLPCSGSTMG